MTREARSASRPACAAGGATSVPSDHSATPASSTREPPILRGSGARQCSMTAQRWPPARPATTGAAWPAAHAPPRAVSSRNTKSWDLCAATGAARPQPGSEYGARAARGWEAGMAQVLTAPPCSACAGHLLCTACRGGARQHGGKAWRESHACRQGARNALGRDPARRNLRQRVPACGTPLN